jgi:hypothetical protein
MWEQNTHWVFPRWQFPRCGKASHLLFRQLEGGNVDGSFGDVIYMPLLMMLVLFGLMLALVGFWRVGSSFSTQLSAQAGSVAPDEGDNILSNLWTAWTGTTTPNHEFNVDSQTRSVSASINTSRGFSLGNFGDWEFSLSSGSGMRVRSERFYPGQPECDGESCNE